MITQNEKGNCSQHKEGLSFVKTFLRHPNDSIGVDSFEGQGESYREREQALITFLMNGETIFTGTKYELKKLLLVKN